MNTTPSPAIEAVELPELPAPQLEVDVWVAYHDGRRGFYNSVCEPVEPLYTADQMRAYATKAIAAERAEAVRLQKELGECQAGFETGTVAIAHNERLIKALTRLRAVVPYFWDDDSSHIEELDAACGEADEALS